MKCKKIRKHGRRLRGVYKEYLKAPIGKFARKSLRMVVKKHGKLAILVGCPKGKWNNRLKRCRVGTRAYKVLSRINAKS